MCNEVFKGIQIVSASNHPESQYCAGGFLECWRRGRCLLLTLLTPECSVRPSLWLLLPRLEHVVWSQHRVIWLQNNITFTAPASHEPCLYHCFQEAWWCSEVVNEQYLVKDSSGGTELEQDFLNWGGVAKRILCISGIVEMLRWSQVQGEETEESNVIFSALNWTHQSSFSFLLRVHSAYASAVPFSMVLLCLLKSIWWSVSWKEHYPKPAKSRMKRITLKRAITVKLHMRIADGRNM